MNAKPAIKYRNAFATLEYESGRWYIVTDHANHGIAKKGVEWDKEHKCIKITLAEKPACFPSVVCDRDFQAVHGADYDQIKIVCLSSPKNFDQVAFIASYY